MLLSWCSLQVKRFHEADETMSSNQEGPPLSSGGQDDRESNNPSAVEDGRKLVRRLCTEVSVHLEVVEKLVVNSIECVETTAMLLISGTSQHTGGAVDAWY